MHRDRFARALLRLYPRAWRQRYGDEFLALIAEEGLSARSALDVIVAAGFERTRSLVFLIRSNFDPQTAQLAPVPFRETVRECAWFLVLMATTVGIVALTGIGLPSWRWWYFILLNWFIGAWLTTHPTASSFERATLALFWHTVAIPGAALAWSIANISIWFGAPEPPERAVYWILGLFFGAVACRGIYCGIRSKIYGTTWKGIHAREIDAWRIGLFAVVVLFAFLDPNAEAFWSASMIMTVSLQMPHNLARLGAAGRRPTFDRAEQTWMFAKIDRS